jgi:hypothetical protein
MIAIDRANIVLENSPAPPFIRTSMCPRCSPHVDGGTCITGARDGVPNLFRAHAEAAFL